MRVRRALSEIPKSYVPTHEDDIPKKLHDHIQHNLTRVSMIFLKAQPVPGSSEQPGWGKPGIIVFCFTCAFLFLLVAYQIARDLRNLDTEFADVHFKSAIANTSELIGRPCSRPLFGSR